MLKEVGLKRIIKYLIMEIWYAVFLLLPYSPLRIWWLRLGGAKVGRGSFIERIYLMNLDRTGLTGLVMGRDCYVGPLALLDLAGKISLGDQVTIAAKTTILSHHSVGWGSHPLLKFYPKKVLCTQIESGAAVGVNSVILPGVIIGPETMVAAGSVVTKNLPGGVLAAGTPAVVKKKLA